MCIYGKITQYENLAHNIDKTSYPYTFKKYEHLWKMQNISLNFASQNISLLMTAIIKMFWNQGYCPEGTGKSLLSCEVLDVTG